MTISSEVKEQVLGVLELSAEARTSVEQAAEIIDSVLGNLADALAESQDPQAEQALQSLDLAREHLTEVAGLFGWVAGELPVFLERLDEVPHVRAADTSVTDRSYRKDAKEIDTVIARPENPEEHVLGTRTFKAWWWDKTRELPNAGRAEGAVGEAADNLLRDGPRGIAIRFGDGEREQAPLRIDIDTWIGRAAVSWQGMPGIERSVPLGKAITVGDDPKQPPVTIPAERARVSVLTAKRAARQYVATGERPTCLEWPTDSPLYGYHV